MNIRTVALLASLSASAALLAGCHIDEHKGAKGGDNVDIAVPFASVHVKTDKEADVAGIGLTSYPGAVPVKDNDHDNGAADINLSFGDFHLGVKAAEFQTPDSPDKVEAFYRKDMARYGDVLKCQGDQALGQPTRTAQGLTCAQDGKNPKTMHMGDHADLRAGSPQHQHVVGIEPKNGGTRIGLVMLDLPKGGSAHGSLE